MKVAIIFGSKSDKEVMKHLIYPAALIFYQHIEFQKN